MVQAGWEGWKERLEGSMRTGGRVVTVWEILVGWAKVIEDREQLAATGILRPRGSEISDSRGTSDTREHVCTSTQLRATFYSSVQFSHLSLDNLFNDVLYEIFHEILFFWRGKKGDNFSYANSLILFSFSQICKSIKTVLNKF